MSDHLPECPASKSNALARGYVCICHALRACEQRMLDAYSVRTSSFQQGYDKGVQSAREAVAALAYEVEDHDGIPRLTATEALAAIDALREVSE